MSDTKLPGPDVSGSREGLPSRREFLRTGAAGGVGAGMAMGTGLNLLDPQFAQAEAPQSPEAAVRALKDGNARFVSGQTTAHRADWKTLRQQLTAKQEPFAAILTCADSRIPVEMVFDEPMGQLFVTRVAGNMITPEIAGSLEYGVAVLGVKVILVLGHSDCGAVKAAIANKTVPGQISSLYPHLQPAVDKAGTDLRAVTEANARIQAQLLRESSTVMAAPVKEGRLKVIAGYYDIGSGAVTLLDG